MRKLQQILLIDDDATENFIHARLIALSHIAQQVVVVNSGQDALTHLRNQYQSPAFSGPELILLDYQMPQMNGAEFLDEFNQLSDTHKSETTCIWLSIYAEKVLPGFGIPYSEKPLAQEDLLDYYRNYCDTHAS